ncbi:hypothetical protein DQP56_19765 [Mycolicibacter senuensis]|nr:hypothetical protein DQP56_19765 [Mycolicibacter senuensis]
MVLALVERDRAGVSIGEDWSANARTHSAHDPVDLSAHGVADPGGHRLELFGGEHRVAQLRVGDR